MYIPTHFTLNDQKAILAFMQQYSFALLVSSHDNCPIATHLPFVVRQLDDDNVVLLAHFAKQNPQAQHIEGKKVMVVFQQPHAYISPKHYDSPINVPTWNYIAIHAYGNINLHNNDLPKTIAILEQTITYFETDYEQQWQQLPQDYKLRMVQNIVAFSINITKIEAIQKLSQNKNIDERKRIINTLSNSQDDTEKNIAQYMLNQL